MLRTWERNFSTWRRLSRIAGSISIKFSRVEEEVEGAATNCCGRSSGGSDVAGERRLGNPSVLDDWNISVVLSERVSKNRIFWLFHQKPFQSRHRCWWFGIGELEAGNTNSISMRFLTHERLQMIQKYNTNFQSAEFLSKTPSLPGICDH